MGHKDFNTEFDLLKDLDIGCSFVELPDLEQLKINRYKRNENVLLSLKQGPSQIGDYVAGDIERNVSALKIQKIFRGYLGRKRYLNILNDIVLESENELMRQQKLQTLEGEILIENYRLEVELEETDDLSRNKSRYHHANAAIIQRAWRESRRNNLCEKEHICCDCNDEFPDLFEYYSETKTLCFCCDFHRDLTNKERLDLFAKENFIAQANNVISGENLDTPSVAWETIGAVLNERIYHTKGNDTDSEILIN
jgi:IQ calmodulin-binding motif.